MAVLDLPAEEFKTLTFGDPNLYPRYREGKLFVLDLKLETTSGKLIDIEVQLADTGEIRERIAAYESRLLGDQLDSGDDFKELSKVITILITDFTLLRESRSCHQKFMVRNDDASVVLTDIFEIHTIELPKTPLDDDGNKLWPWLKFLRATREEELDMLRQHYPELGEPVVRLKELSADEKMREEQRAYEKACRDDSARIYWASKQGEARGIAKVALSMLQEGMEVSMIARLTGLTSEEIEKLKLQ
jgi:predicted transposase/invertase (TIGR01784 family)